MHDVVPLAAALDQLGSAEVAGGRLEFHLRLWRCAPVFILLEMLLRLAHGSQEQVEPLAIVGADFVVDGFDLAANVVEDALAVADALQLTCFFVRGAMNKELAEGACGAL